MINEYNLKKLGVDFMGFKFNRVDQLSFHHMIVPHRDSRLILGNDGYVKENGAILVQDTSHEYLHIIENYDRQLFLLITSELIKENRQGEIKLENLIAIQEMLEYFEKTHKDTKNSKGKLIIKEKYKNRPNYKK